MESSETVSVNLQGAEVFKVDEFKYLQWQCPREMKKRVQAGCSVQ